MILHFRELGKFSFFEVAFIFTIFGAFLVFLGLYIMLRNHKANSRKRRFVKKQLTMEQALSDRLKQRKYERSLGRAEYLEEMEGKQKGIGSDEKYTEEARGGMKEIGKESDAFFEEIKRAQTEGKRWEPSRRYKNAAREEMFQENRRISHRREQLKRLEEGTVLK